MTISRDINLLKPILKEFTLAAIKISDDNELGMKVFETVRTKDRQKKIVNNGNSKTMKTKHFTGEAVDFVYHDEKGWSWFDKNENRDSQELLYIKECYMEFGKLCKEYIAKNNLPIVWGGDWGWDFAHWQTK